ncbi:hypothetical protein Dimus_007869 [Dionaea muscipula]
MPRGNLDSQLFKRLAYLHGENKPFIFRDLKAGNILLDSNYTAKLSEFCFARDGPDEDKTHISTSKILGTKGYVAPEDIMTGSQVV